MKSWFYKLFGTGKIGKELLEELRGEGIVALDEGVKSTLTYIDFRAPGRYSNWKRRWFAGACALTEKRLILQQFSHPVIDLALTDERLQKIEVSLEDEDRLLFVFEPHLFLEDSSGRIEWRCRTPHAKTIRDRLTTRR